MRIKLENDYKKKILSLILPIALQQLLLSAVSAGDSLMLGFVNSDAMAAVSLASNVEFVENLFLSAFIGGATILSAQYWGKGDKATIDHIFGLILRYCAVICIIFAVLSLAIPKQLMMIFTDEEELIPIGAKYIRLASVSYLLTGISQCYLCIMKTTGQTKRSVAISSSALCLDTVLNAIYIFAFNMGAEGAALTTSISRAIELIVVLIFASKMAVKPKIFSKITSVLHKDFLHCSIPHLINCLLWGLGTAVYSAIIGRLGTAIATAYATIVIVRNLAVALCRGMCQGTEIVLADTLGSGDIPRAKMLGGKFSRFSIVGGVFCALLALGLGIGLSYILKLDDITRHYLQIMTYICTLTVASQCVTMVVICGVFASGGDTAFDAYSVGVTMWLVIIPLALCAGFGWKWHPLIVFFILSMDEPIKIPWMCIHYKKYKWLKNLTKEEILS